MRSSLAINLVSTCSFRSFLLAEPDQIAMR
jgi:hypothetical protein